MNEILLINKEKDYTSRDVVNIVGKKLNTKKVGHFGTLDPLATGLLIIGIGKYTKLQNVLEDETKEYEVEVLIGRSTNTYDITGETIEEKDSIITKKKLKTMLKSYQKTYQQEVPIFSAVKVNGMKLYQYARNNKIIKLPKKEVIIYKIKLNKFKKNTFTFTCLVSKGTYIRSLINDISKDLNIPMCMSNLKRTKIGKFNIKNSYTLDDLNNKYKFYNIKKIFNYKRIEITKDLEKIILNGNKIKNIYNQKRIIFTKNKKNLVLYEEYKDDVMKPIFFFT